MGTQMQAEQYVNVPDVKDDAKFEDTLVTHREIVAAISYWKAQKDGALSEKRYKQCHEMLSKWGRAKTRAAAIIQSHQLRWF